MTTTRGPDIEIPNWFPGTLPEFLVYQELVRRGMQDGAEFTYQSSQLGGRLFAGGVVLDFLFSEPPNLAINVQGVYYHYELAGQKHRDVLARAILAGFGITLIFIDEDNIYQDVQYYVGEALLFRDHSRLGR